MAPLEFQVLHLVHRRARPKTPADLCLVLNIEDTHTVNYVLRKLAERDLISLGRKGKEKSVSITEEGADLCLRYGKVREALLIRSLQATGVDPQEVSRRAAPLT